MLNALLNVLIVLRRDSTVKWLTVKQGKVYSGCNFQVVLD